MPSIYTVPPSPPKGVSSDSLLGTGVQLSDKASVKHSIIGHHCKVGDKSKIINCIIMDHVYIGEGLVIAKGSVYVYACVILCGLTAAQCFFFSTL